MTPSSDPFSASTGPAQRSQRSGPLSGLRVLEFQGIGPGPFCGLMLADMGADVLLIDRPGEPAVDRTQDVLLRGRRSVVLDLKSESDRQLAVALIERADVLIEGFRAGVMERLGLGPDVALKLNPRLVYGRMTGWGQTGPLAPRAGHDINYIALTGVLDAIGRAGHPPTPPMNLVGDFGGGGMLLAFGVVCAIFEATRSGKGQVVDAAMVDGAALLATMFFGMKANNAWGPERGTNMLDGGAPWYDVYQTLDNKFVAIGSIEKQFWLELLRRLEISPESLPEQHDRSGWPSIRAVLTRTFASRTRDDWIKVFQGSDACFAPVLSFAEAPFHEHNLERAGYFMTQGTYFPAPAPRLSRTPGTPGCPTPLPGEGGLDMLRAWGVEESVLRNFESLRDENPSPSN
jgi:alpha-methylacyl-CoA racemase